MKIKRIKLLSTDLDANVGSGARIVAIGLKNLQFG